MHLTWVFYETSSHLCVLQPVRFWKGSRTFFFLRFPGNRLQWNVSVVFVVRFVFLFMYFVVFNLTVCIYLVTKQPMSYQQAAGFKLLTKIMKKTASDGF